MGPCYPVFSKTVSYLNRCYPDARVVSELIADKLDNIKVFALLNSKIFIIAQMRLDTFALTKCIPCDASAQVGNTSIVDTIASGAGSNLQVCILIQIQFCFFFAEFVVNIMVFETCGWPNHKRACAAVLDRSVSRLCDYYRYWSPWSNHPFSSLDGCIAIFCWLHGLDCHSPCQSGLHCRHNTLLSEGWTSWCWGSWRGEAKGFQRCLHHVPSHRS